MNLKSYLIPIFVIAVFTVMVLPMGSSAECNGTNNIINSTTVTDACTLGTSGTYTLNSNIYLNGSSGNGAIRFTGQNIVLDGAGFVLIGNNTLNNRALVLTGAGKNNVTVKNLNIVNFSKAVFMNINNNSLFYNNSFNVSTTGIESSGDVYNLTILANRINGQLQGNSLIRIYGVHSNLTIKDNIISNTNPNSGFYSIRIDESNLGNLNLINIYNNSFNNARNYRLVNTSNVNIFGDSAFNLNGSVDISGDLINNVNLTIDSINFTSGNNQIYVRGNNNFVLKNSYFYNTTGLNFNFVNYGSLNSTNLIIQNNTFNLQSIPFIVSSIINLSITNNYLYNSLTDYDHWGNCANFNYNVFNSSFSNNICSNYSTSGIVIKKSQNINVLNNSFTRQTIAQELINPYTLNYRSPEPTTGIAIVELYEGWFANAIDEPPLNNNTGNITFTSKYRSNNITILNNTFNNNVQAYLMVQGATNVTHDLINYWFRSFQYPTYLLDRSDFYINNQQTNLSIVLNRTLGIYTGFNLTNYLEFSSFRNNRTNYQIFQNHLYFVNFNVTQSIDVNLYNQTNSLIYFSNNSVACSDISNCDNNINITLMPNNYSYVLDNFNVTEGVTRQFSPISVSGSSTSKTITSSLSQSVNATVIVTTPDCNNVNRITYNSEEWLGQNAEDVCEALGSGGYELGVNSGSNLLEFEEGTTSLASTFMKILLGFLALTVLLFAVGGFFIHAKNNFSELTPMKFIEYAVLLLLFVVIIIVLINYIISLL